MKQTPEYLSEVNLLVIDDAESDRAIGDELGGLGLRVVSVEPKPDLSQMIQFSLDFVADNDMPIILVDYRLDSDSGIAYRGGTLAAAMKDSQFSCPVVLYTSDTVMRESLDSRPRSRGVFDFHILKEELVSNSERVRREIVALARGYNDLENMYAQATSVSLSSVLTAAMDAPKLGKDFLSWAPASYSIRSASSASAFLLDGVFASDGPLVNRTQAAASIGVTPEYFETSAEWMNSSYSGVYAEMQPRYWLESLEAWRTEQLHNATSFDSLELSSCNWCAGEVSRACHRCNAACGDEHSLPAFEEVPIWSRGHVYCFLCVSRGLVREDEIDPSSRNVADMLISGEIEPEV